MELNKTGKSCRGIICRANVVTAFFEQRNGRRCVMKKTQLNILKRMSCVGCEVCGSLVDQLSDISETWPVKNIEDAKHGKLYELEIEVTSKDFESGFPDEWNFFISEIKY